MISNVSINNRTVRHDASAATEHIEWRIAIPVGISVSPSGVSVHLHTIVSSPGEGRTRSAKENKEDEKETGKGKEVLTTRHVLEVSIASSGPMPPALARPPAIQ